MFDTAILTQDAVPSVDYKGLASISKVYPNTTTDYLMLSENLVNAPNSIFDMTGKAVKIGVISTEKLNINLTIGLYILPVKVDTATYTKGIVVKK